MCLNLCDNEIFTMFAKMFTYLNIYGGIFQLIVLSINVHNYNISTAHGLGLAIPVFVYTVFMTPFLNLSKGNEDKGFGKFFLAFIGVALLCYCTAVSVVGKYQICNYYYFSWPDDVEIDYNMLDQIVDQAKKQAVNDDSYCFHVAHIVEDNTPSQVILCNLVAGYFILFPHLLSTLYICYKICCDRSSEKVVAR
ncbi:hypothetical protein ABPG74_002021 [Tetrahymena malaccensis]